MSLRYLEVTEVLKLYAEVMAKSGGAVGLRDMGILTSALEHPRATFDGQDLYPSLVEKAAALGFFLIRNHPFIDGNKRIGHAAMEVFLMLNGYEIQACVDNHTRCSCGGNQARCSDTLVTSTYFMLIDNYSVHFKFVHINLIFI